MSVTFEDLLSQVQKPARYCGGEVNSVVKDKKEVELRYAFCFPDLYEVGMSHLGMKLLYGLFNSLDGVWCERVFEPDTDMEQLMLRHGIPLFGIESRDPIKDFDMIGFTLQYELCYTSVLHMLSLAGLPVRAAERGDDMPLVMAGGPCTCNPEPLADFIDLFFLGEGEEVDVELIELYREHKRRGYNKAAFLREAAQIEGVYVPSLYDVTYKEDGTLAAVTAQQGVPARIRKRIVKDLDKVYYPEEFVVPYLDVIHDRAVCEIFRGCIRGCRFCQAGMIYRPYREKSPAVLNADAYESVQNTGYPEISLTSLSISDYTHLRELIDNLLSWTDDKKVNLSLPSMRIDNFYEELLEKVSSVRKSGLTFAPEAGTQRLRDVINKNITEEEILTAVEKAFGMGRNSLKLYFMNGLPTETDADICGIAQLGQNIVNTYYSAKRGGKGGVNVTISVSCFVPKPFTPFQWEPQDSLEELERKQQLLKSEIKTKKISYKYHDARVSRIEAVFARGDRRLCKAMLEAFNQGLMLDGWDEFFSYDKWMSVFEQSGIDPAFYANRRFDIDEILPWDFIDIGVTKKFMKLEYQKSLQAQTTPDCRTKCSGCGASALCDGKCICDGGASNG